MGLGIIEVEGHDADKIVDAFVSDAYSGARRIKGNPNAMEVDCGWVDDETFLCAGCGAEVKWILSDEGTYDTGARHVVDGEMKPVMAHVVGHYPDAPYENAVQDTRNPETIELAKSQMHTFLKENPNS